MKTLPQIRATAEQLPIISQNRLGVEVICGAAGTGKTSTALLRLKSLSHMFATKKIREADPEPVRALVLTFNRTLAGYVRSLASHQVSNDTRITLEINTFGRWAMSILGSPNVHELSAKSKLRSLAKTFPGLRSDYVVNEVEYLLGRFEPERLDRYLTTERTGRGPLPRVDRQIRRRLLDDVVTPYQAWMTQHSYLDWNQVAIHVARQVASIGYDVVIVDETQDFAANQLRAIRHYLAADHAITFVTDTVQRIYARGYTWTEVGFLVRPERSHMLRTNHRNTCEIAAFAAGILDGIGIEGDGALPNLTAAHSHGPLPVVIRGLYGLQAKWAVEYIERNANLAGESVAFLKPQGGDWFREIARQLHAKNIRYIDITRESEWPEGPVNVALSTFYSAKGLEFDYVFILGLNDENTPHGDVATDDQIFVLRRLLAVAVARARKAVVLGYKPGEESRLVQYFAPGTYCEVDL